MQQTNKADVLKVTVDGVWQGEGGLLMDGTVAQNDLGHTEVVIVGWHDQQQIQQQLLAVLMYQVATVVQSYNHNYGQFLFLAFYIMSGAEARFNLIKQGPFCFKMNLHIGIVVFKTMASTKKQTQRQKFTQENDMKHERQMDSPVYADTVNDKISQQHHC